MLIRKSHPRLNEALAAWADIALQCGIVPDSYQPEQIWQKDESMRSHVIIRLTGPKRLILKKVFVAPPNVDLAKVVSAHRNAGLRLQAHSKAHVPEILYSSPTGDCVLMYEVAGMTLRRHLAAGFPHAPLLRRSGEWLSAFHGASPVHPRRYQTGLWAKRIRHMAERVENDTLRVVQPDLFLACCRKIPDIAKDFAGQQTICGKKHGDFNLGNLILGENGVTGLDFESESIGPVGFDVTRLLTEYAISFQDRRSLAPGQLLSDENLDAFFGGYELVDRSDPAVRFLPFVRLLNLWQMVPVHPWYKRAHREPRMKQIEFLARIAFQLNSNRSPIRRSRAKNNQLI